MPLIVLNGKISNNIIHNKRIERPAVTLHLKSMVRLYAASIIDRAAGGSLEGSLQRIGNITHAAILVPVGIVYCLHATPAWNIILGSGKLKVAIVACRGCGLHQSLAIGSCAHNGCPVQILQRTAQYLRSRGGSGVYKHHNRHKRIHRLLHCLIKHQRRGVSSHLR